MALNLGRQSSFTFHLNWCYLLKVILLLLFSNNFNDKMFIKLHWFCFPSLIKKLEQNNRWFTHILDKCFRHHIHWVQKTRQLRLPIRTVGSNRMPDPRRQRVPPLHLNIGPSRGYPLPSHPGPRALDLEYTTRVWPRKSQGRLLSPSKCIDIKQLLKVLI